MKFFAGLFDFEIVLLVLGVLRFLVALVKFMKKAKELNDKTVLSDQVKALTTRVEAPEDTAAKMQVNQAVAQLVKSHIANQKTLQAMTRAQAALHRH